MIKYRILYDEKKRFFRSFSKTYPEYDEYTNNKILPRPVGCHDGQRKLLFSEIEFYTELSKTHDLNDILVVYVGSGEGLHEPVIFDMYPELDFFMCDPSHYKFKHRLTKNSDRFYFLHDYYTDNSYMKVIDFNKKNKKIAFICDIREDIDELDVFENMKSQQLWTIQLNSIAYLLKFRLPYYNKGFKYEYFDYNVPKTVKIKKFRKEGFKYLSGKIMTQIYAPLMSTETRLLYIRKSPDEPFDFTNYDVKKYNLNCYYFNFKDRYKIYNYKESKKIAEHILGYDNGYESVCEYYLIYHYLLDYKKKEPVFEEIVKILYFKVNKKMYQYHKLNLIYCPLKTINKKIIYIKKAIKDASNNSFNMNTIYLKLIKKYYIKYLSQLKLCRSYIDNSKKSLLLQKEYFQAGNILPYYIYEKQIKNIDFYYNNFDETYKQIIKILGMIAKNNELTNNKLFYNLLKRDLNKYKEADNVPQSKNNYFAITRHNKLKNEINNIIKTL
jgi:hypothetical protein